MMSSNWIKIFPGVWKLQVGKSPVRLSDFAGNQPAEKLQTLPETEPPDFPECNQTGKYTVVRLALDEKDHVLGGGLLFKKVVTDHQVYHLKVDHFAGMENGSGHAPVPFAVLSNGLGIFCLPQAELFVRQRERPGLHSQAVAWPPRLSAGRRESGSQGPWLGEAAPQPEGNSVCAQQAPARLGFPGALPQRRVVWMWFGAFPGAFGLGRAQPQRRGTSP